VSLCGAAGPARPSTWVSVRVADRELAAVEAAAAAVEVAEEEVVVVEVAAWGRASAFLPVH